MDKVEVPLDSDIFKMMQELSGADIVEIIALTYSEAYAGTPGSDERWHRLDTIAVDSSTVVCEKISEGSNGILDQIVATGMVICNLMSTFLGHMEWVGGLMEIDKLTGEGADENDAAAMNDDTDGASFNPLPGNDR